MKIFLCALSSKRHLDQSILCIKSIRDKGDFTGDIFLFTDQKISNPLQKKYLNNVTIINVACKSITQAASFRLKVFDYISFQKNDIVLYLDTDIVLLKSLPDFTDIDNKLNVYGFDGSYGFQKRSQKEESFAGFLTDDENVINNHPFCSGILLFRASSKIRSLFDQSLDVFIESESKGVINPMWEQPALNLIFSKHDMFTISLNKYVFEERTKKSGGKINQDTVFNHFCGYRGNSIGQLMNNYLK